MSRPRLYKLLAEQTHCVVAMEACVTSRHWGWVARSHGHEARMIPAAYLKPFVKRQKNNRAVTFRTHGYVVLQRTQLINALREHLAEFGLVAPKGPATLKHLEKALAMPNVNLHAPVHEMGVLYLDQIGRLTELVERLADVLQRASTTDDKLRRLCTVPDIGPISAVAAFAPDLSTFDSERKIAAWLGLVPRQRSTGGKARLQACVIGLTQN